MPTEPNISLNVLGGGHGMMQAGGGGGVPPNPLEVAGQVAGTVEKLNSIKLFNAQMGARQKAGQIVANSPDTDSAIQALISDPDISAFAPQIAQDIMTTKNSVLEAAGKDQKLSFDAFHTALGGLAAAVSDPEQLKVAKRIAVENSAPQVRDRVAKSLDLVGEALASAPTPEKRLQLLTGWATAGGWGEAMKNVIGATKETNIGGQTVFGVQAPVQGGPLGEKPGAFTEGGRIANTLSPQVSGQGGVELGGGMGNAPGKNPLVPASPAAPATVPAANIPPAVAIASPLASDGKALFPKDFKFSPQVTAPGYVGGKTPQQALQSTELMKSFTTDGHKEYRNAQTALGMLDEMDENFDTMERSGGFTKPGGGADQRIQLGKVMNMVSDLFGGKPVVDPSGTAAAEDLVKGTKRMGANLTNQLFGTQREAAQTIENITKAVPGIENTYLGGKLITGLIRASMKRSMDEYEFHNKYQNETKGDLTGADISFSNEHPMIGYIKPVLESFGMTGEGFKNKSSLKNAVEKGWLSPQQAITIAKKQGFKVGEE